MRLFVALYLPDAVRRSLAELIAKLEPVSRPQPGHIRWVRPEAMHVTLKFIGHVADEKLPEIRAALASIASPAPVELHFRSVGFFPNRRRAAVLWCGIEASPNLAELAADIERALEPLGIPREARVFLPHLTLARLGRSAKPGNLARAVEEIQKQDFGASRETEFHLYESILKSSGAEYKKLQSYLFVNS